MKNFRFTVKMITRLSRASELDEKSMTAILEEGFELYEKAQKRKGKQ